MEAEHPTHVLPTAMINRDAHAPRGSPTGSAIRGQASGGVVGGGEAAYPVERRGVRTTGGRARLGT